MSRFLFFACAVFVAALTFTWFDFVDVFGGRKLQLSSLDDNILNRLVVHACSNMTHSNVTVNDSFVSYEAIVNVSKLFVRVFFDHL